MGDAPALVAANVAMCIVGIDAALETVGIVHMTDDPGILRVIIMHFRLIVLSVKRINVIFAFSTNLVEIAVANVGPLVRC